MSIADETVFPIMQAPKHLPLRRNGRPVNILTVRKWAGAGIKGVRLETLRIGGALFTSQEALDRFIKKLSEPSQA